MNRMHVSAHSKRLTAGPAFTPLRWSLAALLGGLLLWPSSFAFGQRKVTDRDYYNPGTGAETDLALFKNVHLYHLEPAFEGMKRGNWKSAHDNFEFILRVYPNSPQALNGISELCVLKWKSSRCDADSWMQKAVAVNPDIATTWVIYGIHLQREKRVSDAVEKFERALKLRPDDINAHYNLGLAYFELKNYDKANEEAQMSYALGAPLPGLRDMLKRVGAWKPVAAEQSGAEVTNPPRQTRN